MTNLRNDRGADDHGDHHDHDDHDHGDHHDHDHDDDGHGDHTRLVTIYVNDFERPIKVPRRVTGAAIKTAAGVDGSYELYRLCGATEIPVGDDEPIEVEEGDRFIASPKLDPS